jgi:pimeloyl-ACP methyl ester carboxylesterase
VTYASQTLSSFRTAPIVALHSSASSPRQWEAYRALVDDDAVLFAPTLLGYGDETAWPNGKPVTLADEARHVHELLLAQPQPVHLVGHSYGGAVALQAALLWPGLVHSLTLYEPTAFHLLAARPGDAVAAQEIRAVAHRIGMQAVSGNLRQAAALFVDYWSAPGRWVAVTERRQADVAGKMSKVRAEFEALLHSRMDVAQLATAGMPIRVISGSRSPLPARRVSERLAQLLPCAEHVRLEGFGHLAPLTHARELATLLFPMACSGELLRGLEPAPRSRRAADAQSA